MAAALEAAAAAAAIIRRYYRGNLDVTTKADCTPVTVADVEAEHAIRDVLGRHFPGYGFYGEETGRDGDDGPAVWL
ncbi:MAG: inositol monophosphatase family protein, partial [Pseudomonadota bacterium]